MRKVLLYLFNSKCDCKSSISWVHQIEHPIIEDEQSSADRLRRMLEGQPMEQREQSDACISSAESRQRKTVGQLAFLYVKVGVQSKGIGQAIWRAIETMHPEIEVWETCTPYFDRRNIHFYINRCGFHAIEFFNEHHPDPNMPEQFDQEDGLFKFEKRMKRYGR